MKLMFKRIKRVWLIFLLGSLIVITFYSKIPKQPSCTNPFEVQDYTESKVEPIRLCDWRLYRGSIEVVNKNTFPDLFQFGLNSKDKSPIKTEHRIRVFSREKGSVYVSIISVLDYSTWFNSAIGIYRKEGDKYKQVFKKSFSETTGRWVFIHFLSSEPGYANDILRISGDLGYLGCFGCRINWIDYYDWSDSAKTFVLANNKHPNEFKSLLEEYKKNDKTSCKNTFDLDESITSLYSTRNGKEKFCDDNAYAPYVSSEQATMLLKGKREIELILAGQNLSMKDIKNIKLSN